MKIEMKWKLSFHWQLPGVDPGFLIKGDLIEKFSYQILGNYLKESSFF